MTFPFTTLPPRGRFDRMLHVTKRVFGLAVQMNADIYHFHDPELIPVGLKLKRLGKCVIFDSHEDAPKQLLGKPYMNKPLRWMLSKTFAVYERWACKKFDAIVTSTFFIRDKLLKTNPSTIDVNNFPLLGELVAPIDDTSRRVNLCYAGGMEGNRGARKIVRAMEYVQSNVKLEIASAVSEADLSNEVRRYPSWKHVTEHGFVGRDGVRDIFSRAFAGLVTLHPTVSYARKMGQNGRKAVETHYNWDREADKLIKLYESVSKTPAKL